MTCSWCRREFAGRRDARTCSRKCRQSAFRLRRRAEPSPVDERQQPSPLEPAAAGATLRLAYADPPYLGCCAMYGHHHPDGRCWNDAETHAALVARLVATYPAGWALSASVRSLRVLLPLCPREARLCAWVKPHAPNVNTIGLHNCWEPLIVVGGRQERPGKRDWLQALPARSGGTLPGRKPIAFCAWLFTCLGLRRGDQLDDLFPGTGIVGRSWALLSSRASTTEQLGLFVVAAGAADVSPPATGGSPCLSQTTDERGSTASSGSST